MDKTEGEVVFSLLYRLEIIMTVRLSSMIKLTKLNNEVFIVNSTQIECIEIIPESKVILMNKDFYIVKESSDEIIKRIIEYNAKVYALHKQIAVVNTVGEVDF